MIAPTTFHANGDLDVWHDEFQHGGTLAIDDIQFAKRANGTTDYDQLELHCPAGCGSVSWHPISGGGAPDRVQELFMRKLRRCADPVPGLPNRSGNPRARRPFADIKAYVKGRAEGLDGPGRFKHEAMQAQDLDD